MKQGQVGTAEVRLGPRGQTMITDAYAGMTLYASNSFDPSAAFATLQVNQDVDVVHFTEKAGAYGRGPAAGPPERVADMQRPRKAKAPVKEDVAAVVPGDGADNHGVSLLRAHSSDLTQQGGGMGIDGGEGGGGGEKDDGQIYVPGMGYMNREAVPEHVMQQLAAREAAQAQMGYQQPPQFFPNYDADQNARRYDGQTQLPPVQLHRPRRRGLTAPEQFLAAKLHQFLKWDPARAEKYARPVFLLLIGLTVFLGVSWYRRRQQ